MRVGLNIRVGALPTSKADIKHFFFCIHADQRSRGVSTGPTSRRARVSEPTRVTRPSNPRLLANPSHRRKRLLTYRPKRLRR